MRPVPSSESYRHIDVNSVVISFDQVNTESIGMCTEL